MRGLSIVVVMVLVTLGLDHVMVVLGKPAASALIALVVAILGVIAGTLVAAGAVTLVAAGAVTSGGVSAVTLGVSVVTLAAATVVTNATVTTATVAANATVTTATGAANAKVTIATEAVTARIAVRGTRAFREVVLVQGAASARGVPPGWQAGPAMMEDRTERHSAKGRAGRIPPTPAPALCCRL